MLLTLRFLICYKRDRRVTKVHVPNVTKINPKGGKEMLIAVWIVTFCLIIGVGVYAEIGRASCRERV